jgi:thiamine pyrophosphokinase
VDADPTAIVIAGGDPVDPTLPARLPAPRFVIAADGGLAQAETLGLRVDVVVGDMDSVDPVALRRAEAAGAAVERHPVDKDATDLELALRYVDRTGLGGAILIGGAGGRLDHLLGNALVLTAPEFAHLDLEWWIGTTRVVVTRRRAVLDGSIGDTVTLLAIGGPARGVSTTGLRWRLDGDDLPYGSTRGVSNELVDPTATIALEDGVLLVVHDRGGTP